MNVTRRSVLKASGVSIAAGLAGCVGDPRDDAADEAGGTSLSTGYAAFFALSDWVETVAGDEVAVDSAVSVGEAGHGWEPPSDLPLDVADSDLFIYLDSPEFSWAQNIAAQVEDEGVTVVDVMNAIDSDHLLDWDHDHNHGHDHGHGDEHGDDHEHDDGHEDDHGEDHEHDDGHGDDHGDDHEHDDDHGDDHEHGDDHGDDHDDGHTEFHDPHVWVDPVHAQDMVAYIAEELGALDPDNADYYQNNAEEYIDQLEAVDLQLQELIEEAEHDVAVFAGHDSFRYLEERYGFTLHSPQGVSPDAEPSQDEIAETIELVEDNDIEIILYDTFETADNSPPPLAQRILDSTPATEARPLSPAEGTTAEWQQDGWGWVDQMEELNIPSLRAALGAE